MTLPNSTPQTATPLVAGTSVQQTFDGPGGNSTAWYRWIAPRAGMFDFAFEGEGYTGSSVLIVFPGFPNGTEANEYFDSTNTMGFDTASPFEWTTPYPVPQGIEFYFLVQHAPTEPASGVFHYPDPKGVLPPSGVAITLGSQTIYPQMVTGYEARREGNNRLHKIIGRADPDVTLAAAGLREGTLEIWCADHATALAVEALHAQAGVLHLTNAYLPGMNMSYVVAGQIESRLDRQTNQRWLVTVEYAEVAL